MPVKKISDAPANIRELDDAKLTLAQVNWILRVYDALKKQGKVENPMAVAISQFKRSFHVSSGTWVKNKEEEAAAMSTVDIEHLERYVVVPISGQPDTAEVEDLRELEGDFGHGVYPLWSDERQSIVAFAFEPAFFNEQEAREWVDKAMTPVEMSVIDVVQSVFAPVARVLSKALGRADTETGADPVILHAFAVHLGPGEEAAAGEDADEDQGLIWKEIIHPGKWFKTDTGRPMEITPDIIKAAFKAWKAGLPKYVSVPADSHHGQTDGIVPPQANRGFIEKLKLVKGRLFAGFRFTDPEVARGVQLGNIADVSVFLRPNVTHPETGKQFPWTLQHVLLTNDPLVQDLAPFGVAANSAEGEVVVQSYTRDESETEDEEVREMSDETRQEAPEGLTLDAAEAEAYQQFQGLGLSAADVQALVAGRESVRQKARSLEITRVVRALEGSEEHEGVTQVEGTRHWPVVCVAVEKALREQPEALALAANDDGQTGLDAVVLEIVNALPADGRMALQAQPTGSKDPPDPQADGTQTPTDEQVKSFADQLSPRRGMAVNVPL